MLVPTFRIGLVALAALGIAGVAANANTPAHGLACGVSTVDERGMLTVEGVLQSPTALSGDYRFALKSQGGGGSSNVSQGGPFSIAPETRVSLSKVTVNAGSTLDIDFTVTAGGQEFDCSTPLPSFT